LLLLLLPLLLLLLLLLLQRRKELKHKLGLPDDYGVQDSDEEQGGWQQQQQQQLCKMAAVMWHSCAICKHTIAVDVAV
jgi:hypothetical protein